MSKMGRPPKLEKEKLKHSYKIRVTDQDQKFITEYQENHDDIRSASEVFRQGILVLKEKECLNRK